MDNTAYHCKVLLLLTLLLVLIIYTVTHHIGVFHVFVVVKGNDLTLLYLMLKKISFYEKFCRKLSWSFKEFLVCWKWKDYDVILHIATPTVEHLSAIQYFD